MAKRESDQPVPPAKRADVVRLNIGGKHFETSRLTLEQCPFFMHYLEERGCAMALDDEGRIFVDRDGGLFHILLQSLRTGKRPPQRVVAESRDALLDECEFFQMDWLSSKIRGEISPTDLRPADRLLREAELAARADPQSHLLLDVFKADMDTLSPVDLQLPLLFDEGRERPRLKGAYQDFVQRLDKFSGGLAEDLKGIEGGLVVAGGSVLAALTDSFRAGDLDIFLIGRPEDGERKLHMIMKAVQENQKKCLGADSKLLVLRSNAAVTFMRLAGGVPGNSPAVQVILVVYDSIQQLLIHFDVAACLVKIFFTKTCFATKTLFASPRRRVEDCCCFAWDIEKQKVFCTPRGQRALRYGCNVADNGLFGSISYTRRLERYADRAFVVGVPGYIPEEVSRDLLGSTYVFLRHRDMLLRVDAKVPDSRIMELAHRDATNKVKVSGGVLYTTSVRGFARLVVLATPGVKVSEKDAPEFCWCAAHRKASAIPNTETGAICLVSCDDGQYLILCDAAAVATEDIKHEDANYTESPLAAIYSLIEAKLNHDLLVDQRETAQADTDGWWTGGAMQRIGSSMARRHSQKARSVADETIETQMAQNEPVSFVYDFATCAAPFEALPHVLDAAKVTPWFDQHVAEERTPDGDESFKDTVGIHRRLAFRTFTERKSNPGDWWTGVYS